MKAFMDENFLLSNETAKILYHHYAKPMPIIDYHCHINPEEIAKDRSFENMTQVWLGQDHYKWRQMRTNGVKEYYITGNASDYEKFEQWATTLPKAIGNPLYHWSHLELQRYFHFYQPLSLSTAKEAWELCNQTLASSSMSVRNILRQSNVKLLCTTDDPIDSLEWHKQLKEDTTFEIQVLPTWRPDKAINIEKPDYLDYLKKLEQVSGISITSFASLCEALTNRMEFFVSMGCLISDHGLEYVMYQPATFTEIDAIFAKRLVGITPSILEQLQFKTALLHFLGTQYYHFGWTMQLHFGVKRDNYTLRYQQLGADTGFDCIHPTHSIGELISFLDSLASSNQLPKTILYSLNPADNAAIGTILGCFQDDTCIGKVQQGCAWWFNDNKMGMIEQLTSLANLSLLGNFIGMLTDSRSFLSYTRHEYFRRILCNLVGTWVEQGEYPNDIEYLGQMVQDISYYNAKNYFGFEL